MSSPNFFRGVLGRKWKSPRKIFEAKKGAPKFFACAGLFSLWRYWKPLNFQNLKKPVKFLKNFTVFGKNFEKLTVFSASTTKKARRRRKIWEPLFFARRRRAKNFPTNFSFSSDQIFILVRYPPWKNLAITYERGAHKSVQKSSIDLILHVMVDFHCENIYCNDIILPDYIKCDFGAGFNQKLQILILL